MRCRFLVVAAISILAGATLGEEDHRVDLRAIEKGTKEECAAALQRLEACEDPAVLPALLDLIPRSLHLRALKIRKAARKVARHLPEEAVLDALIGAPSEAHVTVITIMQEQLAAGRTGVPAKRLAASDPTAVAELLGATGTAVAVELLSAAFRKRAVGERAGILRGLAQLSGHAATIVPLVDQAWSGAAPAEKTEILRAMVRLKCGRSRGWVLRFALGDGLEELVPFFDPCFRQDVLLDLVHRLPDSLKALRRLSNQDFGIEDADWKRWISRLCPGYEAREGVLPEKVEDPAANADGPVARSHFYGVPLPEGEFVFLLDASSSMGETPEGSSRSLLDQVKRTVLELLADLDPDRGFNVIFFSDRAKAFRRNLVLPTGENLRKIRRFVGKIRPGGNTSFEAGLRAALKDPLVTDILLLSDGAPNRGRVTTADAVMRLLDGRLVRIHTICHNIHQPLLKEIARRTGGRRGVF